MSPLHPCLCCARDYLSHTPGRLGLTRCYAISPLSAAAAGELHLDDMLPQQTKEQQLEQVGGCKQWWAVLGNLGSNLGQLGLPWQACLRCGYVLTADL